MQVLVAEVLSVARHLIGLNRRQIGFHLVADVLFHVAFDVAFIAIVKRHQRGLIEPAERQQIQRGAPTLDLQRVDVQQHGHHPVLRLQRATPLVFRFGFHAAGDLGGNCREQCLSELRPSGEDGA